MLYSFDADVRDALRVLDTVADAPVPFIGHSKGAAITLQLAEAMPFRCSHLVNIEGLPSRQSWPDVAEHERPSFLATEMREWLDHRARAAGKVRRADTLEGLADRRRQMNPRLDPAWLRYLVPIGARSTTTAGDGRSTPRCGSVASGPGGRSGPCNGSATSACPCSASSGSRRSP
jgi:pimeloyl-ACP methyl ester carboxylesterase